MSGGLKLARKYMNDIDAEFGRLRLESEGIPAIVLKDDAGGMLPQFQMVEGVRLMVREEELERARELLDETEAGMYDERDSDPT